MKNFLTTGGPMPFKCTFRVHWVDTDVAGVMHFTNYLRYFEACEEEFYRSMSLPFDEVRKKYDIRLPRVEAHCSYKAACRFNDLFDVIMRLREVAEKTITWDFEAIREDGKVAAEGYVKCIAVDADWKAIPIPEELAKAIKEKDQ
jgi:YbgC/YbaW family acyl-CoA thioester hydrolase